MQLLLVCLWLVTSALAAGPPLEDAEEESDTPSFSMPVQFSLAAPLFNTPEEQAESDDWTVSDASQSLSHRRGYYRPPRIRRRKYSHLEHHSMMERIHPSRRRRPHPHELIHHHHRRVYPRYPPFLEPYSHNYKLNHPMHPSSLHQPAPFQYKPESLHQHNSYEQFPPYTSQYRSPSQSGMVSSHSHMSSGMQNQPQTSNQQSSEPQAYPPQHQPYSSSYDTQLQTQGHQSSHVQYPPHSSNYLDDQLQNSPGTSNQNAGFPQYPSQYDSSAVIPRPQSHQAISFEYPPLPSRYPLGEISQPPEPSYPEAAMPAFAVRHPANRPYPPAEQGPEYPSPLPKELIDLNKEINKPTSESHKSVFHLLLPLLMVGISIPAIGYMYTHLVRRRSSNHEFHWHWIAAESLDIYMEMFERALHCYQHAEKCL